MVESKKDSKKEDIKKLDSKMEEFRDKAEKSGKHKKKLSDEDIGRQIATRTLLERDYEEDVLKVSFNTSKATRRSVLAKKPNQEEFVKILRMSIEASILEGKFDEKSTQRLLQIYDDLPRLAAELTLDDKLDDVFWKTKVSFDSLQNFISELIITFQQGGTVKEEDMKNFR